MAEPDAEVGADDLQVVAGEDFALVGVELFGEAAPGQALPETVQEPAELLRLVILGVGDQARAVVQEREEPGVDDLALGQLERGSEHHVGHPQLVGQGTLEGLGRAAESGRRVGFEGTGVQVVGRQDAVNRGQTEGAQLERALLDELAHDELDGQFGVFLAPLHQRLAPLRAERLARAFVFAGLSVQGLEPLVAPQVIPALQSGGAVELAAPGPFAGQGGGPGQREVLRNGFLYPARGGVPGQGRCFGIAWLIHTLVSLGPVSRT